MGAGSEYCQQFKSHDFADGIKLTPEPLDGQATRSRLTQGGEVV